MIGLRNALLVTMLMFGFMAGQAWATSVGIETFKDSSIFRDNTTLVGDYSIQNASYPDIKSMDCGSYLLTLAAFDLSGLPAGAVITSAQVGVYDQRTNNSYTVYVSLADVDDTWNESTLDWATAAGNMPVTIGTEQGGSVIATNASMIDFSYIQWQGQMVMNANPGWVWATSRTAFYEGTSTYHDGVAWTDAELLNPLNQVLRGDQVAVFTFTGYSGKNQYFSERTSSDADGATLTLEYDVIQPGDANNDGMVNLADLQILGDNWQAQKVSWAQADFTFDGTVNLADLQIVGDNWGYGVGGDMAFDEALALAGIVIPEPASLILWGGLVPLMLRRRVQR